MQDQKLELANKFAELCNIGLDRCPGSLTLLLVRKATTVISYAKPHWFIECVGPFFYDYRQQVAAHDMEFFAQHKWGEQAVVWSYMGDALKKRFENTAHDIVVHMQAHDPTSLTTIPASLLKMYCQYVQLCK